MNLLKFILIITVTLNFLLIVPFCAFGQTKDTIAKHGAIMKFDTNELCDTINYLTEIDSIGLPVKFPTPFVFRFTNIGTEALIIDESTFIQTGDQYFFLHGWPTEPIKPGQSSILKITLRLASYSSSRDVWILIHSNSLIPQILHAKIVVK